MCARYAMFKGIRTLSNIFHLPDVPDILPQYNIAPTNKAPVVREVNGERELALLRWGLVPFWAKDRAIGQRMSNPRFNDEEAVLPLAG